MQKWLGAIRKAGRQAVGSQQSWIVRGMFNCPFIRPKLAVGHPFRDFRLESVLAGLRDTNPYA